MPVGALDEPLTGFDPSARRPVPGRDPPPPDKGTTALLTTRYQEAETLADPLAIVARGRMVTEGEPTALRERYGIDATIEWREPDGATRAEYTETPTKAATGLMRRFNGEMPGRPGSCGEISMRLGLLC
ncbi:MULTISPECIES: hypothetical protein [unclassified Streptomyces]|uniref:hypothetical protein n=1 Tax=unclassified Streptomyces TaxID=2593676 RepID=UPI0034141E01